MKDSPSPKGNPYILSASVCGKYIVVKGAVYDYLPLYDSLLTDYEFYGDGVNTAVIVTGSTISVTDLESICDKLHIKAWNW